ncbi:hypothetical protein H9I32_03850 [Bacillus sp. Xin]|uniref:hypothetical protein n=1 Tax=unclassified Bacillus (in: firmicutes) TaxID=185979 RepID=UPI0015732D05|nr:MULTISPECIES: hypothetical protein [unclassified Bacillus (in: firmicutes)]MBC6971592.1 hypothetical protein [Bacillus sp. Xin]NSW38322.1 hypothetical protein [Bacillus sp. Xin1]
MNPPKIYEPDPEIIKTYTNIDEINNWVTIRKEKKEIPIYVKARHTETVLFWLVPTGTATWKERQLIGYDIDGTDGWSLKWNISEQILHHHIIVQVLGITPISSDSINVHKEYE